MSQTRSPRPGCQAAWGKALRALTGLFFFLGLLYPYPSNCQTRLREGQASAPYFYAPSEATCVNLCGLFEVALICSIKSFPAFDVRESKRKYTGAVPLKNVFQTFMCLLGILCVMPFCFLVVAVELQTMKVFNKKEQSH